MSASYTPAKPRPAGFHSPATELTPDIIWELIVGIRPAHQRRLLLDPSIPSRRLDPTLVDAQVVRTSGTVHRDVAYLNLVVRLTDGTCRAASVILAPRPIRPIISAVLL